MHVDQHSRRLLQRSSRRNILIDPIHRAAIRCDTPGQKHFCTAFFQESHLNQVLPCTSVRHIKQQIYLCRPLRISQQVFRDAGAQCKVHRTHDDTFPRAGFSCQDIQSFCKINLGLTDEGQIFHMQMC